MNTSLSSEFYQISKDIFIDCQDSNKKKSIKLYDRIKEKECLATFWKTVNIYFKNNDVENIKYNTKVPCSYRPDSSSFRPQRQDTLIKDLEGNLFYIDALTHKKQLDTNSDGLALGSVANAMIEQDEKGVHEWFSNYRELTNKRLKSLLFAFLRDLNSKYSDEQSNVKDIDTFFDKFFSFGDYDRKINISNYHYEGSFDLKNLFELSKNIKEETVNDFKLEVQKILDA